ncbi:MAG: SDR family NAD(P)-dependent oxidoreductase [Phycisphaerae bacterium]
MILHNSELNYKTILSLEHKSVLITGASSGIGRECAIAASQLGANVALVARNKERLDETLRALEGEGHSAYQVDITDFNYLPELVSEVVQKHGKISGFVHSAGIESTLPLRDTRVDDYIRFFETNVYSGFELARIISKKKFCLTPASFVFMSSVMSTLGQPGKVAYCSSKGAIGAGVRAMALELAPKEIRVNCVQPGMVKTELVERFIESMPQASIDKVRTMHPLGLGKPEDIAALTMFLLSDASRWVTGASYLIDGGYSAQ